MTTTEFTTDQIADALAAALKDRDMPAAASLLHMLAVRDPAAAELITAVLDLRVQENDIDATGQCCCNGCIGEGPCDLDPLTLDDTDWPDGDEEDQDDEPDYKVGDTVVVGGTVFTKIGDDPFGGDAR